MRLNTSPLERYRFDEKDPNRISTHDPNAATTKKRILFWFGSFAAAGLHDGYGVADDSKEDRHLSKNQECIG